MTHQPPSQARILLLLAGSTIAGLLISSWLSNRVETRLDKPLPRTEQSQVVEGP